MVPGNRIGRILRTGNKALAASEPVFPVAMAGTGAIGGFRQVCEQASGIQTHSTASPVPAIEAASGTSSR